MTRHIHNNTEHNTSKTCESVLRAGRVSPRRVLRPTNGSSRKDSASSRAVAVRMAAKEALLTGFSLVMGLPGARATTVALRPSSA